MNWVMTNFFKIKKDLTRELVGEHKEELILEAFGRKMFEFIKKNKISNVFGVKNKKSFYVIIRHSTSFQNFKELS